MPHFPPPPALPPRVRRFQRVPPAIFPPILGLFGLGLAWRKGAGSFGVPEGVVELFLGAVSLLFLFSFVSYGMKISLRPGVAPEDAATVPGRGGLAAAAMCMMLLAAVMVPYDTGVARVLVSVGLVLHLVVIVLVTRLYFSAPPEGRRVTPVMHLVYAGVIVAPFSLIPLGAVVLAAWITWYALSAAAVLTVLTIGGLITGRVPVPLRPLQVIQLAPVALVGTAALGLGQDLLGLAMLAWGSAVTLVLLARVPWLIEGGFSGFWSSFTFPVAAFAGTWFSADQVFGWKIAGLAGGLVLVAATLIIPPIAVKVMKLWADGTLAAKTGAATA